jgi:hypothetical protein
LVPGPNGPGDRRDITKKAVETVTRVQKRVMMERIRT